MLIKLDFDLIREIVARGADVGPDELVDPSMSPILVEAGVGKVTAYLERLSLLDIICNPTPIFGKKGGMWIGYKLTEKGLKLSSSENDLRRAVAELIGGARSEVSESVRSLLEECRNSNINDNYKEDFLRTIEEIAICFDEECYIAAISLCGKILEVVLKEICIRNNLKFDPRSMIGQLINLIKNSERGEYLDPALNDVVNIINRSRITAIHAHERIPIPSRDQAIMVIFATRDVVRRNLSHYLNN